MVRFYIRLNSTLIINKYRKEGTRKMTEPIKENNQLGSLSDLITQKNDDQTPANEVVPKSPLEKMKEYKEQNSGVVIKKEDFTDESAPKVFKNSFDNPERSNDFDSYVKEQEAMIEAAKKVTINRIPQNAMEDAALMDQLDLIARQGTVHKNPVDQEGKEIVLPDEEKYGTALNLPEVDADGNRLYNGSFLSEKVDGEKTVPLNEATTNPNQTEEHENTEEDTSERDNLVKILIDKTGLGTTNIDFTPDEREKMSIANEIRVTMVESEELESLTFKAPDDSYVSNIESDQNVIGSNTVPLVASRYRATVKGLGYGELGDLMLSPESPNFEQYRKVYSTIYNTIVSTTIGKFKSFEDFLKNTCYLDMDMLLYGLIVSTYPEVDSIGIKCANCKTMFEQKYFVRDLMDLKRCNDDYLAKLDDLMKQTPDTYESYAMEGPVHKRQYIVLPKSKYIVEIGLASAYDYLYTVINNISNNAFAKKHPQDINGALQMSTLFLGVVRSVSIKSEDGKTATKYSSFEDLIQILYHLPGEDIKIIIAITSKYHEAYTVSFGIKGTKCPKCGHAEEITAVDLNQLIFFKYQALLSTEPNVSSISIL